MAQRAESKPGKSILIRLGSAKQTNVAIDTGRRIKIVEKSISSPAINFTVQPPNNRYGTYTSASVSLAAGTYTLSITGLNPNGGANTA